jgi:hypothetical protein
MNIKYPEITVKLIGNDGNAFSILGTMERALEKAHVPEDQINEFMQDAMSGNYNHLLATCLQWVTVQ